MRMLLEPKRAPPEINYLKKEDFGKVPAYLSVVKEEIKTEKEMIKKIVRSKLGVYHQENEPQQEMSLEEKNEILRSF
jgi:hypothetical protein